MEDWQILWVSREKKDGGLAFGWDIQEKYRVVGCCGDSH